MMPRRRNRDIRPRSILIVRHTYPPGRRARTNDACQSRHPSGRLPSGKKTLSFINKYLLTAYISPHIVYQ